jgi:hypothetical protein
MQNNWRFMCLKLSEDSVWQCIVARFSFSFKSLASDQ